MEILQENGKAKEETRNLAGVLGVIRMGSNHRRTLCLNAERIF